MYTFDPFGNFTEIVLVGIGGTGSQLSRSIGRILYDLQQRGKHVPHLHLVDPDTVELKNVGRQFFTPADVGLPKAQVVGQRLNLALGLNISWSAEPLDAKRHIPRGAIVCGAVDNHVARQEIARSQLGCWIDSGNHRASGQVIIGNTGDISVVQRCMQQGRYNYLPHAGLLFPELLEPEPPQPVPEPTASCAELVEQGEQSLLINDAMCLVVASYLSALLNRRPITTFATFVDLESLVIRSLPICVDELKPYLQGGKR
jgi:PRTRC genetic system ThiF family protein